jgi:uncharacterized C2H2 Zn-finger protein
MSYSSKYLKPQPNTLATLGDESTGVNLASEYERDIISRDWSAADPLFIQHARLAIAVTVCDICSRKYSSTTAMRVHRRTVHTNIWIKCPQCSINFNRKDNLNRHLKMRRCLKRNKTADAASGFELLIKVTDMQAHIDGSLAKLQEMTFALIPKQIITVKGLVFACPQCERRFDRRDSVTRHINSKACGKGNGGTNFRASAVGTGPPIVRSVTSDDWTCPRCRKGFCGQGERNRHFKRDACGARGFWKCGRCSRQFEKHGDLISHFCP